MNNENDISAKEAFQSKGSWIQSKNEHTGRKKSISCQKSKRKKTVISIGRIYVAFSSIYVEVSGRQNISISACKPAKLGTSFRLVSLHHKGNL